jgi:predicted Rossmann fold nucleotide-binding protein DprA/Smf involved in DNA uptake
VAKTSYVEQIQALTATAKTEYREKRKALVNALAALDREYAFLGVSGGDGGGTKSKTGRKYGAVRETVLDAIKASRNGIKPAEIAEKTGLASQQVHNSLTALKKDKLVKAKDGLYSAG